MTGLVDPETVEVTETANGEIASAHGQPMKDDEVSLEGVLSAVEDESNPSTTDEPTGSDGADDIPEKYRGKSLRDVIEMHQNAERQMGRSSNEVGELRNIVDTFIQSQMAASQTDEDSEEFDDTEFITNPKEAVEKAVSKHPAVREAQQATAQMRIQTAMAKLQAKHPDMQDVMTDPGFVEYIKASPVRIRLYRQADQNADYEAADELISSYKERKGAVQTAANVDKAERKEAVRAASTGSSKPAAGAPTSKKVFRRADIIKLMQTDPQRYEALQPEIMAAYAEGRVR